MPFKIPIPKNKYEEAVQNAGYPWISTVELRPWGQANSNEPDRLNPHQHNSVNTHLIIRGRLTIIPVDMNGRYVMDADTEDENEKEVTVYRNTRYRGEAGPDGAVFVEGHSILSPATAERYERRGHLVWYDDGSGITREEWFKAQRHPTNRRRVQVIDLTDLYNERRASV